jgi:hypothetical protein
MLFMTKVPDYIKENIYQTVKRDLEPAGLMVHAKVGSSVAVGGALSLFLCGQMGLGLSPLANHVHGLLMHYGGFLGCTVVCGILFAAVPVLLLRAFSSKIQFLVLLRKKRPAIAGWVLAFGFFLVFRNQQPDVILTMVLWGAPAVASFYLFGWLVHRLSNVNPWHQSQGFS